MNDQVQEEYTITIDRLSAIPPQEILFIDIRDEDSWQHGTIPGAVHIPSGQILASSGHSLEQLLPSGPDTDHRKLILHTVFPAAIMNGFCIVSAAKTLSLINAAWI